MSEYDAALVMQLDAKVAKLMRRQNILIRRNAVGNLNARESRELAGLQDKITVAQERLERVLPPAVF